MANQFTTGQGQGYDPNDPMNRTLASGVNSGQGLQNMDPGKVANPYSNAAQSIASNVTGPPASQSQQPPAPANTQTRQASSSAPMVAPAPNAPTAPPNPYMAPARVAHSVTTTGTDPGLPRAGQQQLQVSPTGTYLPPTPSAAQTTPIQPATSSFDPVAYKAYGQQLLDASQGKSTLAQDVSEGMTFGRNFYTQGEQAANASAGRGITGVSGGAQQTQNAIAGNIAQALANKRADDVTAARSAYGQYQQQGIQQQQFEEQQKQEEANRQQQATEAFNSLMANIQNQQAQREIDKQKLEQQNEQFYLGGIGGALGGAAGSVFGPAGSAAGAAIGRNVAGMFPKTNS